MFTVTVPHPSTTTIGFACRTAVTALILSVLYVIYPSTVQAHTIRPAVTTVTFSADRTFEIEIKTNAEALLARIGPEHEDTNDSPNAQFYNSLRELEPTDLAREFEGFAAEFIGDIEARLDGAEISLTFDRIEVPDVGDLELARDSLVYVRGTLPADAGAFTWRFPEAYGSNVLRLTNEGSEDMQAFFLAEGETSPTFELTDDIAARSRLDVARDYLVLGFTHILPKGLDHILFVLGIFLLSFRLAPIIWQVTAFTIAHTITLGMTIYGLISLSPSIVEPLIALSIVYVGVENILVRELKPWRVVIVFLFGLLHGMGFAGVLTEIGLPRSEFLTALITFNIGVEFGQLAVIALALLAVGWFRKEPWYRSFVVIPASALISLVALYWTIERII